MGRPAGRAGRHARALRRRAHPGHDLHRPRRRHRLPRRRQADRPEDRRHGRARRVPQPQQHPGPGRGQRPAQRLRHRPQADGVRRAGHPRRQRRLRAQRHRQVRAGHHQVAPQAVLPLRQPERAHRDGPGRRRRRAGGGDLGRVHPGLARPAAVGPRRHPRPDAGALGGQPERRQLQRPGQRQRRPAGPPDQPAGHGLRRGYHRAAAQHQHPGRRPAHRHRPGPGPEDPARHGGAPRAQQDPHPPDPEPEDGRPRQPHQPVPAGQRLGAGRQAQRVRAGQRHGPGGQRDQLRERPGDQRQHPGCAAQHAQRRPPGHPARPAGQGPGQRAALQHDRQDVAGRAPGQAQPGAARPQRALDHPELHRRQRDGDAQGDRLRRAEHRHHRADERGDHRRPSGRAPSSGSRCWAHST